jgi:hypothetical protein
MLGKRQIKMGTNLVLLENTPFFTALELATLAVVSPLDGIAHRRHFERLSRFQSKRVGKDEDKSKNKISRNFQRLWKRWKSRAGKRAH